MFIQKHAIEEDKDDDDGHQSYNESNEKDNSQEPSDKKFTTSEKHNSKSPFTSDDAQTLKKLFVPLLMEFEREAGNITRHFVRDVLIQAQKESLLDRYGLIRVLSKVRNLFKNILTVRKLTGRHEMYRKK